MEQTISQKIIKNTIFNIAGRIWGILVALVLTPYIIRHIGIERFGIWAIIGVITGYFGLIDFGVGTSFVKYIAEFYSKKEYNKINQIINTGVTFYFLVAIGIIVFTLFFLDNIITLLKIPSSLSSETVIVLWIGIIIFAVSNILSVFGAIQAGLQRMDITTKAAIIISIFNIFGTVFFLEKGYGLVGLMINNAIIFVITAVINIVIAFRILPELKLNLLLVNKNILQNLFNFGYKLQISRVANLISFQFDKLLITYFLGVSLVTHYQLGSSILLQIRQIPLLLISALVPAVSELEVKNGKESLKMLYLKGSKYIIFISVPLTFFMIANASLIIRTWMGEGYRLAELTIQILAFGYLSATITGVASSIAVGVAKTDLEMKFGVFLAVLNLCLNIILIKKIGFIGVVIGSSVSLTIASFYYVKMFHEYLNCRLDEFFRLLYKPIAAVLPPTVLIIIFNYGFHKFSNSSNRFFNIIILICYGIIFGLIYLYNISFNKYLDDYDRVLLISRIPLLKYFK